MAPIRIDLARGGNGCWANDHLDKTPPRNRLGRKICAKDLGKASFDMPMSARVGDLMTIADEATGVLAIWNDIRDGREGDFESWYKDEHFLERLAVPGFRLGRRYEAVVGTPQYFCYYLTDTPDTLTSGPYLERLNNPTPRTRAMMSEAFSNMHRTVCARAQRLGALSGALNVTARFHQPADPEQTLAMLDQFACADGIARCELWSAVASGPDIAVEERLRGGDRRIAGCMMVETLRLSDAERVHARLVSELGDGADLGIYRLLCELASDDVA
jgi:hypothetical protein